MEQKKHQVLFILGGPGSGKGTQCENLIKTYGFVHFSTGDLLRAEVKKQTELGKQIDSYISKGNLVPGETTVMLVKKAILERTPEFVFILDGYPRNQENVDVWEKIVGNEIEVLGCLFLECSEEMMKNRILNRGQGRSDDNEEVFKNRIHVYHNETVPITKHFKEKNTLFSVSAEGTKEQCFEEIKKVIHDLGLQNMQQLYEMRKYINQHIDPYIKPLIVYLMKKKPDCIHQGIRDWLDSEGLEIKRQQED